MMSRPKWLALGVLALAVVFQAALVPGRARAAEPARPLGEAITVEPGATCLDAATLVEHVQSWVGGDTLDADVVVDVRGSPDQPRVVGFRMLRGGQVLAVRRFDPGPSRCEQLHAVLGLAIAMALNASLVEDLARTAIPAPRPAPLVAPPAVESLAPWAIAVDALVAVAVLPDPAPGIEARIEKALTPTFRARLDLLAVLAPGESFAGAPGHFETWLLAPRLDLCAAFELAPRVRPRACMGLSAGALRAQGYSYPLPQSTFIRWLAVANELGVAADLSRRWSIDASAALILPVARNSIVLRDYSGNVLQRRELAPVGWIFGLGPLFRF
jgi:hypothetical protein